MEKNFLNSVEKTSINFARTFAQSPMKKIHFCRNFYPYLRTCVCEVSQHEKFIFSRPHPSRSLHTKFTQTHAQKLYFFHGCRKIFSFTFSMDVCKREQREKKKDSQKIPAQRFYFHRDFFRVAMVWCVYMERKKSKSGVGLKFKILLFCYCFF